MNKYITKAIIYYVGIVLFCVCLVFSLNLVNEEKWEYERNRDAVNALVDSGAFKYAEYSTSGLKDIDTTVPYLGTTCNYSTEQGDLAEQNKIEEPCLFWRQLYSAQFDFQRLTVKARVLGSDELVEALDKVENGFMQVFDKVISEEYYMRTYQDNYNLIMPPLFEELENAMHDSLE